MSPASDSDLRSEEISRLDRLAIERTAMAADRTLMAWTRTGLSMISFGFTIYKLMEGAVREGFIRHPGGPKNLGLFLIALGTLSLGLGMLEHWGMKRALGKKPTLLLRTSCFLTAGTILFLGLFLFITIVSGNEFF